MSEFSPEEMTEQKAANKAFVRAMGGYKFRELPLEPYSALRQAAALEMGLMWGMVPEDKIHTVSVRDEEGNKVEVPTYGAFFLDVVIVLWLCLQTDEAAEMALSEPKRHRLAALRWADTIGLSMASPVFSDAGGVFWQIMRDISASATEPAPDAKQRQRQKKRGNE